MTTLDIEKVKVVKRTLHTPQYEEIKDVFTQALLANFAEVEVEIVDCPDLTQQPFTLASPGICGNPKILEIGGPPFLLPTVQRDKVYNIRQILKHLNYGDTALVIGAGAGPWPYVQSNCELIMNVAISPSGINNETRVYSVDRINGSCIQEGLPTDETRFALLANLFLSEGKLGKVLKVHVKKRIGEDDFIASMQKALAAHFKDKLVGMGGTFLMKEGKAKQHVMPDFSTMPITNNADLNNWLHFYNMSAPLIAVGTFVSAETDLDLRVQHFHDFSHHGEGGHYHNDTTPEYVEYLGYFNVGNALYRIDQPIVNQNFGKD